MIYRLVPDTERSPIESCCSSFPAAGLGWPHPGADNTSCNIECRRSNLSAPSCIRLTPSAHRIDSGTSTCASSCPLHGRRPCARSCKSKTSCNYRGKTHPCACSLDTIFCIIFYAHSILYSILYYMLYYMLYSILYSILSYIICSVFCSIFFSIFYYIFYHIFYSVIFVIYILFYSPFYI